MFAIFGILLSSKLFGTSWSYDIESFCKFHYSSVAYEKPVSTVVAHIGVLAEKPLFSGAASGDYHWQNVQDVNLGQASSPSSVDFSGSAILRSSGGKFGDRILYPVVQYFVGFADGTGLISEVYELNVTKTLQFERYSTGWEAERELMREAFYSDEPILSSSCEEFILVSIG